MTVLIPPGTTVKNFISSLCCKHNIGAAKGYGYHWAKAVTRLAGDDPTTDSTHDQIVALARAGIISEDDMIDLSILRMREERRV